MHRNNVEDLAKVSRVDTLINIIILANNENNMTNNTINYNDSLMTE